MSKHWVLLLTLGLPLGAQAQSIRINSNEAERRVDVLVDAKPFTSYIWPASEKKPSLYPLITASGKTLTRGYPIASRPFERVDHPHHVGLWFNYGDVNGLDFWNNSGAIKASDAHKMGTVVHRTVRKAEGGNKQGVLEVTTDWVNHEGKALLREDARFVFRADGNVRSIDRITTLTALDQPVAFNDNKEGVLGIRVARELEHPATKPEVYTDASGKETKVPVLNNEGVTGKYLTSEGKEGEAAWGTRGRWNLLTGVIAGEPVALAILDHPSNPGFPTYWHSRGYGLFAANPLGQSVFSEGKEQLNFKLDAGKSVTFRHRVLVINGPTSADQIEKEYQSFTKQQI